MLSEMTMYSMEWLGADVLAKSVKQGDLIEFRRTMPYRVGFKLSNQFIVYF
jgi:hypothetical protein